MSVRTYYLSSENPKSTPDGISGDSDFVCLYLPIELWESDAMIFADMERKTRAAELGRRLLDLVVVSGDIIRGLLAPAVPIKPTTKESDGADEMPEGADPAPAPAPPRRASAAPSSVAYMGGRRSCSASCAAGAGATTAPSFCVDRVIENFLKRQVTCLEI